MKCFNLDEVMLDTTGIAVFMRAGVVIGGSKPVTTGHPKPYAKQGLAPLAPYQA